MCIISLLYFKSRSRPPRHSKYVGKRKWGSLERKASANLLKSPLRLHKTKMICPNIPESITVNPLPSESPKPIPQARISTAKSKFGVSFNTLRRKLHTNC